MLRKIDDAVLAVERGLTVLLVAVMALAVFGDTVHRVFSSSEGRVERLLLALTPAAMESMVRGFLAPAAILLATFGVAYGALRSAALPTPIPPRRALVWAAAATAGLSAGMKLFLWAMPNGLIWSQKMALCFMLWVGFIGASIATRDRAHIVFEVAGRIWPKAVQPAVRGAARAITAAFAAFLGLLSIGFTRYHYVEWRDSGHVASVFEGFEVPMWTIYGFLPIAFAVMTMRFLLYGASAPEGEDPIAAFTGGAKTRDEASS